MRASSGRSRGPPERPRVDRETDRRQVRAPPRRANRGVHRGELGVDRVPVDDPLVGCVREGQSSDIPALPLPLRKQASQPPADQTTVLDEVRASTGAPSPPLACSSERRQAQASDARSGRGADVRWHALGPNLAPAFSGKASGALFRGCRRILLPAVPVLVQLDSQRASIERQQTAGFFQEGAVSPCAPAHRPEQAPRLGSREARKHAEAQHAPTPSTLIALLRTNDSLLRAGTPASTGRRIDVGRTSVAPRADGYPPRSPVASWNWPISRPSASPV
jgi:hypothetical protein